MRSLLPAVGVLLLTAACAHSGSIPAFHAPATMGKPRSTSPGRIAPAPMARTHILPSTVMDVRPQTAFQGASWSQLSGVASFVAAAPDDSLWVLSDQPAGSDRYIWHYANGTWTNISGLASRISVGPDGTLYAINSGGGAWKYSGGTWTSLGGGCSDITAAVDGSIYVLSNGNAQGRDQAIWHYTGTWSQVPGSGLRIGASWDPNSFTISAGTLSAGGLYILNSGGSIYYENPDSSFAQLPGTASAIAPTAIGGVFILSYPANASGNNIYYYDFGAQSYTAQGGTGTNITNDNTHLYVTGSSGAIYFSPVKTTSRTIVEYPVPTSSAGLYNLVEGPDGNIWFTELNASKVGYITRWGAVKEFTLPANSAPLGIAKGPDNRLWVAEDAPSEILAITTAGGITHYPTGGLSRTIAVGGDGRLWFTEPGISKIGAMTTSGALSEYPILTNGGSPFGITAGSDGNMWFTEANADKLGRITTSGTALPEYSSLSHGAQPLYIVAHCDGDMYFTENGLGRLGQATPNGSIIEFSPGTSGSGLYGIAEGGDGYMYFAEANVSQIGIMQGGSPVLPREYNIGTGTSPTGVWWASDGNVWFTDNGKNAIGKFSTDPPMRC